MLVRISGGSSGIKQYLEDGRKQGRGQTRDELDERVILDGDLQATDLLIESSQASGEKYLHITLSFKEDAIDRQTLHAIVQDFKAFALSAYREDEYSFYAEAHLPRIKSYLDAQTGDTVERKPHIHIVIPKTNYLSGGHLNPVGLVEDNTRYLDAWQEHINDKYGLASPKDNRRVEFTSESEVISRHKGDLFDPQGKELKTRILDAMLERDVRDLQAFRGLLEEFGERRTRNAGQANEYENLKAPGAARGLNLKDFVFSREFIELPAQAKRERLAQEFAVRYETAGQARPTSAQRLELLQQWTDTRSREIKYLNSGNRRAWREYQQADPEARRAILDARQARFYAKHDPTNPTEQRSEPGHERTSQERPQGPDRGFPLKNGRSEPPEPGTTGAGTRSGPARQHDPGAAAGLAQTESLHRVRNLSSLDVVRDPEGGAVLLPGDAADQLEHGRTHRDDPLRRDAPGGAGVGGAGVGGAGPGVEAGDGPSSSGHRHGHGRGGRDSDSLAGQHLRDAREERAQARAAELQLWRDIRASIDARVMLADLSRSHGVQVDKYDVSKGADGSDRIRCGDRSLNVSDFLTKELHLPWDQAQQLLRDTWTRQLSADPNRRPMPAPSPGLWREFNRERRIDVATVRQQTMLGVRKSRAAIGQAYQEARTRAGALPPAQRRAAVSVARMARIQAEQRLRDQVKLQRTQVRTRVMTPALEQYRGYLQDRATKGDERALGELRRMAAAPGPVSPSLQPGRNDPAAGWILAGNDEQARRARDALYSHAALAYTVARNGDVTYQLQGRALIRDSARKIDVMSRDADVIETALRLAQQKFGQTLTLAGSKAWQEQVARTAGERGIKVRFSDERLNALAVGRAQQIGEQERRGREAQKGAGKDREGGLER